MRKCLSLSHYNINIPVSHDVFNFTFSYHQVLEISLSGSLVMNIRYGLEIPLAQHEYINQKSDLPFHTVV